MPSKRILIVGGVAGGASCAARLRRLDENAEIYIFERSGSVSFANCGLPYYLGGVIAERNKLLLASPERFRDFYNIEVRTRYEAQSIDRQNRTIEVRNVQTGNVVAERYDALVLAPGAAPIRLQLPGVDLPGIFALRNLDDIDAIQAWIGRRKVEEAVVVGAGYIGLEMAENLHRRGISVTLLELGSQIMPQMDPEMVQPAQQELRRHGIDLRLGTTVMTFESGQRDSITVVAKHDERFTADMVILAVGVKPEVTLAQKAGLEIGSTGGIRVNERMQTSDPAIYAVGDAVEVRNLVTGLPALIPLAGPANRQGRVAADAICGRFARFPGSLGTAVVGVFDLTLATTGATEKSLNRDRIPFEKSFTHPMHHTTYYPGAERFSLKLLFAPDSGRLLGAQAVGHVGVDKCIDSLATALQMKATVFDLEEAELCYAPQYGSAKSPVNMAGFVASNIARGDVKVAHWSEWKKLPAGDCPVFRAGENGTVPLKTPVTLDVRPIAAVVAEAIPGTIRIPLSELRARLDELPRDREIWIHCVVGQTSYNAARLLAQHGFKVRNLSGGITSYKMEG